MFENLRKKNIVETIPKKVILPEIEAMGEPETADEIEIYDEEEEINEPLKEEKVEQEVEEPTEENFDESEIEPDEEYNAYVEKEKDLKEKIQVAKDLNDVEEDEEEEEPPTETEDVHLINEAFQEVNKRLEKIESSLFRLMQ